MILIPRDEPTHPPQDLPAGDNLVDTGTMGDCVCVVVLWNPAGGVLSGKYANVRGYHGGGCIENVNFAALFNGVPNHATTQIINLSGTLNYTHYRMTENRNKARQEAVAAGLGNAMVRSHHNNSRYHIDRFGNVKRL